LIANAGKTLENAGADCLFICSNTMHACADHLEEKVNIPLLHIVDAVGNALTQEKVKRAGLLGTKFLMQSDMYSKKLRQLFNIEIIIPEIKQIQEINEIIYSELVKGKIKDVSKKKMKSIIQSMQKYDIESIILGCTEIPLLIKQGDCHIPVADTTEIHAKSAVNYVISTHSTIN